MVKEHREPSTPRTVAKLGAEITMISASPTCCVYLEFEKKLCVLY